MAKDCGPSAAQDKLTSTIDGAKGTADGLIADATNGIATQVSGLKSQISGLTDGIKADLDVAAPELPKPAFTLQSQMTNLLSNADNPGALVQQMDEIREKFGDKVDVDGMFDEFGLDSKELGNLNTDYKSKLSEANKIKEDAKEQIKAEKDRAISDIKKEVVDLSLTVAEKLIKKNISEDDNASLIEESLEEIKQYEA